MKGSPRKRPKEAPKIYKEIKQKEIEFGSNNSISDMFQDTITSNLNISARYTGRLKILLFYLLQEVSKTR